MIIGIYKITSPSNKIYIGQSTNIEKRWNDYKKFYNCISQSRLYRSLKKYDSNNHKFEILNNLIGYWSDEQLQKELDELESFWINHYNSIKEGLNIKEGGIGGKHNQETKDKISKALKNKPREEWVKEKISKGIKGRKFNEEWKNKISENKKGYKYSKESRKKIGDSNKGKKKKFNYRYLSILQYDLDGNLVKEWENSNQVIKELSQIGYSSLIKVCRGERNHKYKGYIWKWKTLE